ALKRQRHDIELLSEAFGRYMRLWFAAHVPSTADAGKAAGRSAAEADYTRFAQHVGAELKQGHRFTHDFPAEAFAAEDDVK
ncbi:MAG: hypothetical protein ACRENE_02620, partial [Polyangiaceae bacterium]